MSGRDNKQTGRARDKVIHEAAYKVGDVGVKLRATSPAVPNITEKTGGAASSPPQAVIDRATGGESLEESGGRLARLAEQVRRITGK